MGWLRRLLGRRPQESGSEEAEDGQDSHAEPAVERACPGLAAAFAPLREDSSHRILDFGSASESKLRVFGGYAERIRFAGLLPRPPLGPRWGAALEAVPPDPGGRSYDVVLAWNLLDLLGTEERILLVRRLDELTAPAARLYVVVDASGRASAPPLRFTLLGLDRLVEHSVGHPEPTGPRLLSAEVERLLRPFEVVRSFTLRQGLREHVAVKGGEGLA